MFNAWPSDHALEVCFWEPVELVGTNEIKIPSLVMSGYSRPLDYVVRKTFGSWMAPRVNKSIVNDQRQGNEKNVERKETLKELVRGILDISPLVVFDKKMLSIIDNFKPDVVYTMGATIFPLKLALFFSQRYHCKIVLHCMDNWRDTVYTTSTLMTPVKKALDRYLRLVEQRMKVGLAISEMMAREYMKRSGCTYKAIMNCVTEPLHNKPKLTNNKQVIFTYAGGMHLNRWKSLLEVEKCISTLCKKEIPARLYIYTSDKDREKYENLFNSNITKFKGFLLHDQVHKAYDESDILLHIESFQEKNINFTKYSLSTKIPEYMSAGKPILCFAPTALAVSEYINQTRAGVAVSSPNELSEWAEKLATSPQLRLECAQKGLDTVVKTHTHDVVHSLLREVLNVGAKNAFDGSKD